MTEQTPAANAGAGTPAGGSAAGTTAGQTASANPGQADIDARIAAALAPMQRELESVRNQLAAARRTDAQPAQPKPAATIDPTTLPESVRGAFTAQQAELDTLKRAEEARVTSERNRNRRAALEREVGIGQTTPKFANAQIMADLIEPHLREGANGEVMYEKGGRSFTLAQAVADIGAQDMFRAAPAPNANGVQTSPAAGTGGSGAAKPLTAEDLNAMSREQRKEIRQRIERGEVVAFKD